MKKFLFALVTLGLTIRTIAKSASNARLYGTSKPHDPNVRADRKNDID